MFDMKYIPIILIAFLVSCGQKNDACKCGDCSIKYTALNELPLDVKFYPFDVKNHKLKIYVTAPKEHNGMKFLYFDLIWIPKDPVSIERFQYGQGVPVSSWESTEQKGSMIAELTIPTAEADRMAIDVIYTKQVCDRYVYRLAIKRQNGSP